MADHDSWDNIHNRGQATVGIWQTFNPSFTVGEVTLASHSADVAAMPATAQVVATQEDVIDAARATRDVNMAIVRDLSIRLPRAAEGSLAPGDPLRKDIRDIRLIEPSSLDHIPARGRRTLSFWLALNAKRAAMTPAQPVLTVAKVGVAGQWAVADLQAALTGLETLEQGVEIQRSELSKKRSLRDVLAEKVDTNNKRWYEMWGANYPPGTPEGDALVQIDTGSGGGGEPLELPTAPAGVAIGAGSGSGLTAVSWAANPAAEAVTLYTVRRGAQGGEQQVLGTFPASPAEFNFTGSGEALEVTVSATNATGEGPQSELVTGVTT